MHNQLYPDFENISSKLQCDFHKKDIKLNIFLMPLIEK